MKSNCILHTAIIILFSFYIPIIAGEIDYEEYFSHEGVLPNTYAYLDNNTCYALAQVSKKIYGALIKAADCYYSVCDEKKNPIGWVKLICSNERCLQESCTCRARKYRGILHRKKSDGSSFKLFLTSSCTRLLRTACWKAQAFTHFLKPTIVNFSESGCCNRTFYGEGNYNDENKDSYYSYSRISIPYCNRNNSRAISVLEGLPTITHKRYFNNSSIGLFFIPNIYSIFECTVQDDGTFISRYAMFEYQGKEYHLGLLSLFPVFFEKYIQNIVKQSCDSTQRNGDYTIYQYTQFDHILGKVEQVLFAKLLYICRYRFGQHSRDLYRASTLKYLQEWCPLDDPLDWVRFSFLAQLTGNKSLALAFLRIYDHKYRKPFTNEEMAKRGGIDRYFEYSYSYCINLKPLGGVCATNGDTDDASSIVQKESDYEMIMKKLTSLDAIEPLIKNIQASRNFVSLTPRSFAEIQKSETTASVRLWQFCDISSGPRTHMKWCYDGTFTLINCPEDIEISQAELKKLAAVKDVRTVKKLTVVEKSSHNTMKDVTHILSLDNAAYATSRTTNTENAVDKDQKRASSALNTNVPETQNITSPMNNASKIAIRSSVHSSWLGYACSFFTKKYTIIRDFFCYLYTTVFT